MICIDTIEDKILQLRERKKALAKNWSLMMQVLWNRSPKRMWNTCLVKGGENLMIGW